MTLFNATWLKERQAIVVNNMVFAIRLIYFQILALPQLNCVALV